jgi:cytochrome c-type biogenesis protein
MTPFFLGLGASLWFGILTSISPCPLANNIAAISFVSRRAGHPRVVLFSGLLYTLGRMATYVGIGTALVSGLLAIPGLAVGLQKYMNILLGPILVVAGVLILGIIPLPSFGSAIMSKIHRYAEQWGEAGAFLLGLLFALSFCPVSAGLFFGSLIPLAITQNSRFIYPALYGLGTALPVLFFAGILSFSAKSIGRVFNKITELEKWARWITAGIFILVGLYYSAAFTLRLI